MNIFQIALLAVIQGLTELLPVSSTAHVIVAEKLMGIDPTTPEMTFFLVMLHTGTMIAVIYFFWPRWKDLKSASSSNFKIFLSGIFSALIATFVVGMSIKYIIEKFLMAGHEKPEIELLFGKLSSISIALFFVGVMITIAGSMKTKSTNHLTISRATIIGAVQGLCLPFRGFSRSGATISTGMFLGISKNLVEDFSFAMAVIITPPIIVRQILRILRSQANDFSWSLFTPGLLGMIFSFFAGLVALRWLSSWVEKGNWKWFGYYCLFASVVVFILSKQI